MFNAVKKIFLWNYARNSWQWDILCVLILTFIFLTPKEWFLNSELGRIAAHPSPISTLILDPEVIVDKGDRAQLEERLRKLTQRPHLEVLAVREVLDEQGRIRSYEIDIR